jgi:hypothetical protein
MRLKLAELKALVREGNEERRELRQMLADAESALTAKAAADETAQAADHGDLEGSTPIATVRGISIPTFSPRASESLRELPARIAAEALRTIGSLAAGDVPAWRGVKQAKLCPVLMARVSLHYRLLFRVEGGVLEVIDVLDRASLEVALKRLRAT